MLEVEVAANTVYAWAAEEILARRLGEERPSDPAEYAARREAQSLRQPTRSLMRAFLDDDVYEGRVRIERSRTALPAKPCCSATERPTTRRKAANDPLRGSCSRSWASTPFVPLRRSANSCEVCANLPSRPYKSGRLVQLPVAPEEIGLLH